MIDTIRAKMVITDLGKLEELYCKSSYTSPNGNTYVRYTVDNISITTKQSDSVYELWIMGSLSKFLYGTNLVRFTRTDVHLSIEKLSAKIGIDISEAVVKRIDIAANLIVAQNVNTYLQLLSYKKRFKKSVYRNYESVYFLTDNTSLSFYDKRKEFIKNNKGNPSLRSAYSSIIKDKNIIRYELKLKKKLEKVNNGTQVKLKDIYTVSIYKKLIRLWYKNYTSIVKDRSASLSDFKDFKDYLMVRGIEKIGGLSEFIIKLDSWCKINGRNKQHKSYIKTKTEKLYSNFKTDKLIKELNQKIKFEKEFYL